MKAHSDIPKQTLVALLLAAACCILPLQASAAAYLKIGDIKGESKDRGHENEIDVLSWSWGMSREVAVSGGGGAGKANFKELSLVKELDKSSPKLAESCVMGVPQPNATLTLTRAPTAGSDEPPLEYLVIHMTDVLVTSVSFGEDCDDSDNSRIPEKVTLTFSQVEMIYTPQDPATGGPGEPVIFAWDIAANTEG